MRKGFLTLPTELQWLAYSLTKVGSRGNSVGGLPRNCGSIPSRGKEASRIGLGPTQSPIRWVPGIMRPGSESDNPPPSSVEVKNAWSSFPLLRVRWLRTQETQFYLTYIYNRGLRCAMAQEVSRWPLIAETWVQSQSSKCGIYGGQSRSRKVFCTNN
jgi:hypothetical protein